MKTLRAGIESQLLQVVGSPINPDRSNSGKILWSIYCWQVICELAERSYKSTWASAVESGLIKKDEDLRQLSPGQHLVTESNKFSVLVKISEPRRNFDRAKFLVEAAKKFKIDKAKLEALVETCMIPGNPSLTKDVVELEK